MSMGPAKGMDEVSRDRIWGEHLKKENRTLTLNSEFHIGDPRKSRFAICVEAKCS